MEYVRTFIVADPVESVKEDVVLSCGLGLIVESNSQVWYIQVTLRSCMSPYQASSNLCYEFNS